MKMILAMVSSVDGKTTRWNNSDLHSWTSKEDQEYFSKLIEENNCIIMGRKTYEAAKNMIKHRSGKLRIVLTGNPKPFNHLSIPGQLEFTNKPSKKLIKRLEDMGYANALLVGGATVNTLFLKENLVDELWLTLEPKILGNGNGLVGESELDVNLQLLGFEKLNNSGTLLLKYKII